MGAAREGCFAPRSQVPCLRTDCRSRVKNPKVIYKYMRLEVASPTMIQLWARCTFCDFIQFACISREDPVGTYHVGSKNRGGLLVPTDTGHET